MLVTECSMADNVAAENPGVDFVRPCNLCPHMKRITLPKILDSLVYLREEVTIDPALAAKSPPLCRADDRVEMRPAASNREASPRSDEESSRRPGVTALQGGGTQWSAMPLTF